ncbi:hemagglutinin [Intrasporangium sp. YIM S08009]|uniref:hemagglutinin n=1 Tax=Intrasporangium zincisolvens TaxID=3080018 RepID=UPI002B0562AA|nr:hemagglutinin [Intrasporangium sp. YIM S08009]
MAAIALAAGAAALSAPTALAGSTPPFTIGPNGSAVVPGADGANNLPDLFGSVKELGPLNSNTTKIGVIHSDAVPTLGLTNPNAQVDLRQGWTNSAKDSDGDDWLYFAWERDSNSGSGFIAYEFMQDPPPAACAYTTATDQQLIDTCNPWANRKAGDFMILWDQQGGSRDLYLRTWSGTAPNLVLSPPGAPLNSSVSAAAYSADGFRGEAALNLTDAVFGGVQACRSFANVIPSTVTGNSDTADYKDTILQPTVPVGGCTSTTVTTPKIVSGGTTSDYGSAARSITTDGVLQVKDSALISLAGGSSTPGGTVQFSLCKASNTTNATCDSTATTIGSPVTVTGSAFPATVVSPSAWVTSAGRFCWKAVYSGVPASGIAGSSDVSTGECFTIDPVTPTLSTTAGSDVTLGSAVTDTATLTGTAPKPTANVIETSAPGARTPAGGTIAFTLWGPSTGSCGTQVTAANQSATVSGDSSASNVYSASFTPTAAGDYHWKAVYSGDSPNTNTQSHNATCNDTNEDVTVGPASTGTVTTPRVGSTPITAPVAVGTSVTDHAVVTGTAAGGSPTGTVAFFVCNPTQVTANGGTCSTGGTTAGSVTPLTPGAGNTATADSNAVVANAVGTWCFRAVYTSNTANYTGSSDASTGECFQVKDTTAATSAQNWLPNDSATITSTGGTNLNGTLSFTLYSGDNCGATSGSILRDAETFTLTDAASPATRVTTNSLTKVSTTSTVSWLVSFTSTDALVGSSTHCEKTSLTITN